MYAATSRLHAVQKRNHQNQAPKNKKSINQNQMQTQK